MLYKDLLDNSYKFMKQKQKIFYVDCCKCETIYDVDNVK